MANSISTNIDLLAQGTLDGFLSVMAPLNAFSTNFSPARGQVGQAVQVPLYGSAGVANNFGGDYSANSDSSIGAVTVNLDKHFYKTVHVTDTEAANQGADLHKLGFYAGASVAQSVVTGSLHLITTGAFGLPVQTIGSVNNFHASGILAGRTAAVSWGADKNAIVDSAAYSAMLGSLPANVKIQDEALKDGAVGKLYGFNMFESNAPKLAGDAKTIAVFAHPSAIAVASRYLQPDDGGTYIDTRQVTDPKTNVSIGTRLWYNTEKGKLMYTAEWLGGAAVGVTGAAKVIQTA
jgi:hypothetical protein